MAVLHPVRQQSAADLATADIATAALVTADLAAAEQPAAQPVECHDRGCRVGSLHRCTRQQLDERRSGAAVGLPWWHEPALHLHREPAADGVWQQVPGR